MSNGLTFEILIQISQNFQGRRRNSWKEYVQNFMEIDLELTEKSAKNTQRWWKLTATIEYWRFVPLGLQYRIGVCTPAVYIYTCTINGGDLSVVDIVLYLLQRDHLRW